MKRPRFKRVIVPIGSIWPQPKPSPRMRYRWSWGAGKDRQTITCTTTMESTLAMVNKRIERLEQDRTGLLDAAAKRYADEDRRPIDEHLEEWKADLAARGNTDKHVRQMHACARALLLGNEQGSYAHDVTIHAGSVPVGHGPGGLRGRGALPVGLKSLAIARISEIIPSRVRKQIGVVKAARSAATANRYRDALLEFLDWGVSDTRWPANPCAHLERFKVGIDRKRIRRALPAEQFAHFIEATHAGPINSRLSGPQRSLIYRTVCALGLRATESRRLPLRDCALDAEHVSAAVGVWIDAKIGKNRKRQFVPLPLSLAAELLEAAEGRGPDEPLLVGVPSAENTARMIERDLERAGIPYKNADGVFDFHGLRHECGALLISAGCNVKAVQQHMRHSSIQLTLDTYGHLLPDDREHARQSLRSFDAGERATLATEAQARALTNAQRKLQRERASDRPRLSSFVPGEPPAKGGMMQPAPKNVENSGSGAMEPRGIEPRFAECDSAIDPAQLQPRHNLPQVASHPLAQSEAPNQPIATSPGKQRVRYSTHGGIVRARVIKPTSAKGRAIRDFNRELVAACLDRAERERQAEGVPSLYAKPN